MKTLESKPYSRGRDGFVDPHVNSVSSPFKGVALHSFVLTISLQVFLYHADKLDEGQEFIVTGDKSQLVPKVDTVCPFEFSNLNSIF